MPVYFIKDKATGKPLEGGRESLHKQDLKGQRDRLNQQFCSEKPFSRYVIGEYK